MPYGFYRKEICCCEELLTFKDAALLHRDLRNKIHIGTALFVALLTPGIGALMASFMDSMPGATEAAALSSALSTLAWISLIATLITYLVALRLPKPQVSQ